MTSSVSPSLLPNIHGSSILQLLIRDHSVYCPGETGDWGRRRRQVTIDILPDDVLEIFAVYANKSPRRWPKLLHVCRRWRSVVLASTRRLNLHLRCTYKTPVRKMPDIWPALPIVIKDSTTRAKGADNIVAALGHPDRVRRIELEIPESDLNRFAAEMRDPFPELTFLYLGTIKKNMVFVLPDSFLGGSAPRLRVLRLYGIPFPAVPKLLSSASGLVDLHLLGIPHSGYISPEAMVTGLSALTRLKWLHIQFRSPRSRPDQPSPPRSTRTVLPSLTSFLFRGVSEYLEDLTSRIDAPLLSDLNITFFNQLIFNTPRLCSFISDAEKLRSRSQAHMTFDSDSVELSLTTAGRPKKLKLGIRCEGSDWQLSALTQFCDLPSLSHFNLERLQIRHSPHTRLHWLDVENTQWLGLLRPFTTVKCLSLSREFTPRVLPALLELSRESIMDVLPALQSIFFSESSLSEPVEKALAQFLTARQLSGHPVAVNPSTGTGINVQKMNHR